MSRETFEIVQGMDVKKIETQLALQCAPLLTGIKISNLLIVPSRREHVIRTILNRTGISCYRLAKAGEKTTYLLFHRQQLETFLAKTSVSAFFDEAGYSQNLSGDFVLGMILAEFSARYQMFLDGGMEFPHEMGLLLGYPIEDVRGFIENEGRNYLYAGYWKVYADKSVKIALFKQYKLAQETLIRLVANGVSIRDIIEIYQDERMAKSVAV